MSYAKKVLDKMLAKGEADPPDPPVLSIGGDPEPEYDPFPVRHLPQPLQAYVVEGAKSLGCSAGYLGLPALVAAAGCIGNTRVIQLKRGFKQPCILWGAVVGPSGSMKTPAYDKVLYPLFHVQHEWIARGQADQERYERDLATWEAKRMQALRDRADFDVPPPDRPLTRRLVTSDTTVERIAVDLDENPRGLILARSELAGWLGSFARYRGAGSDLQTWLEFFDGSSVIVDRKGGDKRTRSILRASVSVIGGIPPGTYQASLSPDNLEAGLGARILVVFPPDRIHEWTELEIDPDTASRFEACLTGLMDLDFVRGDPAQGPVVHKLHPAAKRIWVAWYNAWERKKCSTTYDPLRACYAKLHGYAARLALVHHVVSYTWAYVQGKGDQVDEVSEASVVAGTMLAEWFGNEAARLYLTLPGEDDLVAWIRRRGGEVTVRDLVSGRKAPDAEQAKKLLTKLVFTNKLGIREEGRKTIFFLPDLPEVS